MSGHDSVPYGADFNYTPQNYPWTRMRGAVALALQGAERLGAVFDLERPDGQKITPAYIVTAASGIPEVVAEPINDSSEKLILATQQFLDQARQTITSVAPIREELDLRSSNEQIEPYLEADDEVTGNVSDYGHYSLTASDGTKLDVEWTDGEIIYQRQQTVTVSHPDRLAIQIHKNFAYGWPNNEDRPDEPQQTFGPALLKAIAGRRVVDAAFSIGYQEAGDIDSYTPALSLWVTRMGTGNPLLVLDLPGFTAFSAPTDFGGAPTKIAIGDIVTIQKFVTQMLDEYAQRLMYI